MVEVKPDQQLVDKFPVKLLDGSEQMVYVSYLWKPNACLKCKVFRHIVGGCEKTNSHGEVNESHQENAVDNMVNNCNDKAEKLGDRRNKK